MTGRKPSKLSACVLLLCALSTATWGGGVGEPAEPWTPEQPGAAIDVAIALDTSGSMQVLIDAARLKLWDIVYDLTLQEPTPKLRVALLTYGNAKHEQELGWVRVETDLTEDLDQVSERLFALTSDGAVEYVGRVLQAALEGLSWTPSEEALKLIFVVGNESADQDPQVDFREMSGVALREGIFVHAIFCGIPSHPDAVTWKQLADLSQGQFASINRRSPTVVIETPVDEELAELSAAISQTYIPLGEEGVKRQQRLVEQDENARKLSPAAAASRAQVKASPLYSADWDLVDALETGKVSLHELEESDLPESLREMSFAEQELYVEEMRLKRQELRQRTVELSGKRRRYVAQQIKARGLDDSGAFDSAVRRALRERLKEKGFQVSEP